MSFLGPRPYFERFLSFESFENYYKFLNKFYPLESQGFLTEQSLVLGMLGLEISKCHGGLAFTVIDLHNYFVADRPAFSDSPYLFCRGSDYPIESLVALSDQSYWY